MNAPLGHNHHFDPDAIFRSLEDAAERMQKCEAVALRLEKLEKPFFSQLVLEYRDKAKGVALAEHMARADERFAQHVEAVAIATSDYNRAKARYFDLQMLAKLRQTQEASTRELTRS